MRIANAPISWGVFDETSDVDPERFLDELVECGYAGTEFGPPGYLGDSERAVQRLEARGLPLVGAFFDFPFHEREKEAENAAELHAALDLLEASTPVGSAPMVLLSETYLKPVRIASAGRVDMVPEAALPEEQWDVLLRAVVRATEQCRDRGFRVAFHPHAATYIETQEEIERLLSSLSDIGLGLCVDTGHTFLGGSDPIDLINAHSDVITHMHIKDVDPEVKAQMRAHGIDMEEAWRRGIFCELGQGAVDLGGCLGALRDLGFDGWGVVEQDIVLDRGDDLAYAKAAAQRSRDFLRQRGF